MAQPDDFQRVLRQRGAGEEHQHGKSDQGAAIHLSS